MADAAVGFDKAHELAERLYEMQTKQADQILQGVNTLTASVSTIQTDVVLVKHQMSGIPERVLALENLRYKAMAFVAAVLFLLWAVQTAISFFKH